MVVNIRRILVVTLVVCLQEMALGVVRKTLLLPDELCGILLGSECATPPDPGKWNITMSSKPKPPVAPHVRPQVSLAELHA